MRKENIFSGLLLALVLILGSWSFVGAENRYSLSAAGTGVLPAPGDSGNLMTSNGSAWTSAAAAGGGDTTVYRTADRAAINNSTTLVDDGVLQFSVTSGKHYRFRCIIRVNCNPGFGDTMIDYAFTGPTADTTIFYSGYTLGGGYAGASDDYTQAHYPTVSGAGIAVAMDTRMSTTISGLAPDPSICMAVIEGVFFATSTDTFKLQVAQTIATAEDTVIMAGSFIQYKQLN